MASFMRRIWLYKVHTMSRSQYKSFLTLAVVAIIIIILNEWYNRTLDNQEKEENAENDEDDTGIESFQEFLKSMQTKPVRKIVLIKSYGTGTSIFAELFRQHSEVYYLYEPFKLLGKVPNNNTEHSHSLHGHPADIYAELLNCDNSKVMKISTLISNRESNGLHQSLIDVFGHDIDVSAIANSDAIVAQEQQCKENNIHVLETISEKEIVPMKSLMVAQNVHVFVLVKDPRAMVLSRLLAKNITVHNIKTLLSNSLANVAQDPYLSICNDICEEQHEFIGITKAMLKSIVQMRPQFVMARYEDFVFKPTVTAQLVYNFVDLTMPRSVDSWLSDGIHTENDIISDANYGTDRNFRNTAQEWRDILPYNFVNHIQSIPTCLSVMDFFGYGFIRSTVHQRVIDSKDNLLRSPSPMLKFILNV